MKLTGAADDLFGRRTEHCQTANRKVAKSWQCQPLATVTAQRATRAREIEKSKRAAAAREQRTVQRKVDYAVYHFVSPEQPSGSVFRMAGFAVGDHYRPLRSSNK